jgi:hypothetical protein
VIHRAIPGIGLALGIVATCLLQAAGHAQAREDSLPRAVVPEIAHDFGPVELGGRASHAFAIHNAGAAPLSVLRVEASDPGMKSRFKPVIAPGETGFVSIDWDSARTAGNLDAHAVVHLSDPKKPRVTLTMTGVVRQSIVIQPTPDVVVSLYPDQSAERRLTIVNKDDRPLAIRGIRVAGSHFKADLRPVEPGKSYEVLISVPTGLDAGQHQESLFIDTDHPRLGQLHVAVNVFVKKNLYVTPDVIDFGELSIAQVRTVSAAAVTLQTSTIRKREGNFTITNMSTDVPGLRLDRSPAGSSNVFGISVRIDPNRAKPGSLKGMVRIETDDKLFPVIELPVHGEIR